MSRQCRGRICALVGSMVEAIATAVASRLEESEVLRWMMKCEARVLELSFAEPRTVHARSGSFGCRSLIGSLIEGSARSVCVTSLRSRAFEHK